MPRLINSNIEIGKVFEFSGAILPNGYLRCDGAAYNAVVNPQYQDLFNVIGNTYGGTNNTNFKVPDKRGVVSVGLDTDNGSGFANKITKNNTGTVTNWTRALGNSGGEETHQLTTVELAQHSHGTVAHSHSLTLNDYAGNDFNTRNQAGWGGDNANNGSATASTTSVSVSINNTGNDIAHNNVQPSVPTNFMIRY